MSALSVRLPLLGLLALAGCTLTHEAVLGSDGPADLEEADAGDTAPGENTSEGDAEADLLVPRDASSAAAPRDAALGAPGDSADGADVDAGAQGCTLHGHRPLDIDVLPPLREWDGGLLLPTPSLPGSGLSLSFEAGVPPFCCTPQTPLFCAL